MSAYPTQHPETLWGYFEPRSSGIPYFPTSIITVVLHGPNTGLSFLGSEPPYLFNPDIVLHPALYVTTSPPSGDPERKEWHDWYDDQDGIGAGSCRQTDMPALRQFVERHEGVTLAPNSHFGTANAVLHQFRAQDRLEELYTNRGPVALIEQGIVAWRSFLSSSVYHNAQQEFHDNEPDIRDVLGCTLDFRPKPWDQ